MPSWTVTEPQRLAFDEPVTQLDASMFGGRLSVVGTDGPARVEVDEASQLPLTVTLDAGRLVVRHHEPKTWPGPLAPLWWWLVGQHRLGVRVSVAVLYATPVVLRVTSGPVAISSMRGEVCVTCTSGRVVLLGVQGRIRANVVSGPIEVLGCAGEVTLETVSGEITVRVREDSDLSVRLSATHGRVTTDFPDLFADGRWGGTQARGVLGAGTGSLVATAMSGHIALLRRPVDDSFGEQDEA
jgi:hypothetical protein